MTKFHSDGPDVPYSRASGVPVPNGAPGGAPLHGGLPLLGGQAQGPGPASGPVPGPASGPASGLRCRVRVGSADGVLAIVPHLLGFYPADSLVVLGIGGPHARIGVTFRYDLPDPPEQALAADIAAHARSVLGRQDLTMAVVVGYGPGRIVTPVIEAMVPAMLDGGIVVQDVLRVEGGRFWSYLCSDPACCPPDGVPFDPAAHPAAGALAAAGFTARRDRAALAGTIAPAVESAPSMAAAVDRARLRAANLIRDALGVPGARDVFQPVADAGRRSVRQAVATYRRGGKLTQDEIAWLGLALTDLRVRDDAWARMDPSYSSAHLRLWTEMVRLLPAELVPAPAALLAFTSWQAGDGAMASIAIERALQADPEYSMALLVAEALHAGLPPSAARLPMTPKQVAASYARRRTS